jgi:hypothetical protein
MTDPSQIHLTGFFENIVNLNNMMMVSEEDKYDRMNLVITKKSKKVNTIE